MKALTFLSAVQTVAILFLVVRTLAPDSPAPAQVAAAPPPRITTTGNTPLASEEQLRAIIREEVATQVQIAAKQLTASQTQVARPRDPEADRTRQERVAQHIENYRSAGVITDQQMADLQLELARLDETSRRQMMSKLVKAMNSGEIRGRF